jgi:hypothetical protein
LGRVAVTEAGFPLRKLARGPWHIADMSSNNKSSKKSGTRVATLCGSVITMVNWSPLDQTGRAWLRDNSCTLCSSCSISYVEESLPP